MSSASSLSSVGRKKQLAPGNPVRNKPSPTQNPGLVALGTRAKTQVSRPVKPFNRSTGGSLRGLDGLRVGLQGDIFGMAV